ncbi:cupin domain-containing protein [Cecembia rubra]|uniref:Cupin domain-containing protein n=1 Tax=Cecembia rubra TaxID=1485585 RepID=A0A2P8E1F0_9BACT|nr:cupin domain-containing protein [Cecembia rubra]PSL03298.1 Cupin domain-containing protein [Cecembia rubra]
MKKLFILLIMALAVQSTAQTIKERIISNDPAKYRELSAVHEGAGKMGFTQLIGRNDLATNFLYLHAGQIQGKSGIGHHFHHSIEEMFVILDGEAEFTVNGRTAKIKGPAVVPCKMGDSHAIFNPSDASLTWLNFAVSRTKGRTDAFDLGDARVGVSLDPVPTFVNGRLEKEKLRTGNPAYSGEGVLYRRILGPEVFQTDWNHVDHVVIPVGGKGITRKLEGFEEVYYVTKGKGVLSIGQETLNFKAHDAFWGALGETLSFSTDGNEDLEVLVIGIAAPQQKSLAITKPLIEPKAMVLQMEFVVDKENAKAFEEMYYSIYVPAMVVQQGYLGSKLLRLFPENLSKEIQAEPTTYNYQIMISFDTEENRRKWVASKQHDIAWPAASGLAREFKWKGYDVMGDDNQN